MNLREAAQQALEYIEQHAIIGGIPIRDALRAALAEATIKDNLTVEPVAYVTGFSKGYATVQPVDPCLLMSVGMALYRSPPTSRESRQVEPVAFWELQESGWEIICDGDWVKELPFGTKLYTTPPKREPLTDEAIHDCFQQKHKDKVIERRMIARAIERAHRIGGEE